MIYKATAGLPLVAKVYDVPADLLISELTGILKGEGISVPGWAPFVKTGVHAERPPHESDWWHKRCASLLRKIYLRGPVGIGELRKEYGGGKPRGYGAARHRDAGGAIIRNAVHELEKLGYVERAEKRGRILTRSGMQKLDRLATEILGRLAADDPKLKMYS